MHYRRYLEKLAFFLAWLFPLAVQAAYTLSLRDRLSWEEVGSLRGALWLHHRTVYDGTSSNVGWYAILEILNRLFGFSLHSGIAFRFALAVLSTAALWKLLGKYLGAARAVLPYWIITLSPTLLYFNTFNGGYGIDLQFFPIALYGLDRIDYRRSRQAYALEAGQAAASMFAALCYPSVLFYVPALLLTWRIGFRRQKAERPLRHLAVLAAGFLAPLAFFGMYLRAPRIFFHDPVSGAGVFRGGGGGMAFSVSGLGNALGQTFSDLFVTGASYYYMVPHPDFSDWTGMAALAAALLGSLALLGDKNHARETRVGLVVFWLIIATSLVLPHLSTSPMSGLRRCTGILAGAYGLFVLLWHGARRNRYRRFLEPLAFTALAVLLSQHLWNLSPNLQLMRADQPVARERWLAVHESAGESLELWRKEIEAGHRLNCWEGEMASDTCRYDGIYALLAQDALWNRRPAHPIKAFDRKSRSTVELALGLWESYALPH
jgi:hypothetical protein